MVKHFNMSLRDLDPEGIVRHEDLVGLRKLEEWHLQREYNEAKRAQAKQRLEAKRGHRK